MRFKTMTFVATLAMMACATDKSNESAAGGDTAQYGPDVEMYFRSIDNNTYYDANAEFDTLSYAVGINYAMAMQGLYLEDGLDRDVFINSFRESVKSESVDCQSMYRDIIANREFQEECYMPYNREKQRQSIAKRKNPDTVMVAPKLFNEDFDNVATSSLLGRFMANQLRIMHLPVNLYWVDEAFEDVKLVENIAKADSLLSIPVVEMVDIYRRYIPDAVSKTMQEHSDEWLANVAKQEGVVTLQEEGMNSPIYYRIDREGSDRRPVDLRDSITIDYTLYSCHGILIESKEERLNSISRKIEYAKKSTEIAPAQRDEYVAMLEKQLEASVEVSTTLNGFFQEVVSKCLPNIGEGGMITVWMPATYAPNLAMGSKGLAYPNEAIVLNVELIKVTPVAEQVKTLPMPLTKDALKPKTKVAPQAVVPISNPKGVKQPSKGDTKITVKPVSKAN